MPVSPQQFDNFEARIRSTLDLVEQLIDHQLLEGNQNDIRISAELVPMRIRLQVLSEQFWATVKKRYEEAGWKEFTCIPVMSADLVTTAFR